MGDFGEHQAPCGPEEERLQLSPPSLFHPTSLLSPPALGPASFGQPTYSYLNEAAALASNLISPFRLLLVQRARGKEACTLHRPRRGQSCRSSRRHVLLVEVVLLYSISQISIGQTKEQVRVSGSLARGLVNTRTCAWRVHGATQLAQT